MRGRPIDNLSEQGLIWLNYTAGQLLRIDAVLKIKRRAIRLSKKNIALNRSAIKGVINKDGRPSYCSAIESRPYRNDRVLEMTKEDSAL